jgi:hypothetical protein
MTRKKDLIGGYAREVQKVDVEGSAKRSKIAVYVSA